MRDDNGHVCPVCFGPARNIPPKTAPPDARTQQWSHGNGTPLCPVDDTTGAAPAEPVEGEAAPCLMCGEPTLNAVFCPDCEPDTDANTEE